MSALSVWFLFVVVPNLGCLAVISLIGLVIWLIVVNLHRVVEEYESDDIRYKKVTSFNYKAISICVLCGLIAAGCPDKKEMVLITVVPYISNNPEFKKLPENIVGMLNDLIKEYRAELSPKELKNTDN